jgi:antitoxin component YwqK of YwqJK toxin-antitoxin module
MNCKIASVSLFSLHQLITIKMKNKYIYLFILPLVFFIACNNNNIRKEVTITYGNGEPQKIEHCQYQGNKRIVNKVEYYYPNGNLESEYELKDGKKHGKQIFYYKHGAVELEESYENGKLNGKSTQYFVTGDTSYEASYKDDLPHGEWKYFDDNGELYLTQKFENGTLIE